MREKVRVRAACVLVGAKVWRERAGVRRERGGRGGVQGCACVCPAREHRHPGGPLVFVLLVNLRVQGLTRSEAWDPRVAVK